MKQRLRSAAVALAVAAAMTAMVFAPAAQMYAAAKKKTIYVISRITSGDKDESYKFSYNKNGMVKKVSARSVKSTYKYDKKKVSEEVQEVSGETGKVIYSYDGKGRLKELVSDNPDGTQASYVKAIKKQQKEMADTPMAYMFVVH